MTERGWTITDLVMEMGPHFSEHEWNVCQLSWEMLFAFCEKKDPRIVISENMAQQLSDVFGPSKEFFINFHEAWRKSVL